MQGAWEDGAKCKQFLGYLYLYSKKIIGGLFFRAATSSPTSWSHRPLIRTAAIIAGLSNYDFSRRSICTPRRLACGRSGTSALHQRPSMSSPWPPIARGTSLLPPATQQTRLALPVITASELTLPHERRHPRRRRPSIRRCAACRRALPSPRGSAPPPHPPRRRGRRSPGSAAATPVSWTLKDAVYSVRQTKGGKWRRHPR